MTPILRSSRVVEDYLTLIWKAYDWPDEAGGASTTELAAALGVTPSTVSATLKKLARQGLIRYEPYGSISLTDEGEVRALEMVRRHRIIESYLVTALGIEWSEVHEQADLLEHAVSDLVLDKMDESIGRPARDPHGDSIPRGEDVPRDGPARRLGDVPAGTRVRIVQVSDRQAEVLRFLSSRGLGVGVVVTVLRQLSPVGIISVRQEDRVVDLSLTVAQALRVEVAEEES